MSPGTSGGPVRSAVDLNQEPSVGGGIPSRSEPGTNTVNVVIINNDNDTGDMITGVTNANEYNENIDNVEPMEVDEEPQAIDQQPETLLTYTEWLRMKKLARNRRTRGQYDAYRLTEEQRQEHLAQQRQRQRERRQAETEAQRAQRLDERNWRNNHRNETLSNFNLTQMQNVNQVGHARVRAEESVMDRIVRQMSDRNHHRDASREARTENLFCAEQSANIQGLRLGKMTAKCSNCQALHFECERVGRLTTFNDCCNHAKVKVDLENEFPEELKELFKREHEDSNQFHKDILKLNSSLSFATMIDRSYSTRLPGIFHYNTQGEVSYSMEQYIDPMPNSTPLHGQLWIIETADAVEYRMRSQYQTTGHHIHTFLHNLLKDCNDYAKLYKTLDEQQKEEERQAAQAGIPPRTIQILFKKVTNNASNPNALPHSNEVAGIYVTDDNGTIPLHDIAVQSRPTNGQQSVTEKINRLSRHVEPLTFVLFNPTGKGDFWFTRKPKKPPPPGAPALTSEENSMTPLRYYMYKLSDRSESPEYPFNPILYGGKLLSKYLIHAYSAVEHQRTDWIRKHQKTIRVDTYTGLTDYINNFSEEYNVDPGRVVVLPSTFSQGPRCQSERFHDAMASVQQNGSPHLFITMTANPNHPDVLENLKEGQQPFERPDLVDRVFHAHTKIFFDIMKSGAFGVLKHHLYVVEFQKRGLPHIHCLFTFEENDWKNVDKIDRFISAELPDPRIDPEGYALVVKHHIHKPCGPVYNPDAMCMENGRCKRNYPKNFVNQTIVDNDSYPQYRRKDSSITATTTVRGQELTVDNRSVVPYNMFLLKLFQCHLNVEVVSSLGILTYLYKYFFKGPDTVQVEVRNGFADYDEISSFLQARYMSAHEAFYRISEYTMHFNSDVIERMQVHLPEQQVITMREDVDYQTAVAASLKSSKLLACFKLNTENPDGKCSEVTYPNLCHWYTWNSKHSEWHVRKSTPKPKCPRLYVVDPKRTELFYLRQLLLVVKGPKSFEHLRTDPNNPTILYPTFRDACVARGLAVSDQLYIDALEEGILHNMPYQLRRLFARMVAHCDVEHPFWIWCQYRKALCSDLLRKYRGDMEMAEQHGLRHFLRCIKQNDRDLNDYPIFYWVIEAIGSIGDDAISVDAHRVRANRMQDQLNAEQRLAFDAIISSLHEPSPAGNCFFVNGPGGSGKTFLFNCLYSTALAEFKKVIIMAWSGIAASLYPTGRTCHNVFKLDFPFYEDSNSGVKPNDTLGKDLLAVDVIIWDEAPMAPRHALEVVDAKLREITGNNIPFGGKIMILGGDFCQLPPVVKHGSKYDIIRNSIKTSSLWHQLFAPNTYKLVKNQRAHADADSFPDDIQKIGNGTVNDTADKVELPPICIAQTDLVQDVFQDVVDTPLMSSRAILCTLNKQVDEYNEKIMDLLDPTTERTYTAFDRVEDSNCTEAYTPEYFETFRSSGFPAYTQRYRKGAIVMLMRNLNIREGLCNGTRLRILELCPNLIIAEKLNTESHDDNEYDSEEERLNANKVMIPRITLQDDSTAFTLYRHQFPLRTAFAMTINKSQGQTFEKIGIDLSSRIFSHGHLYVAISRTRAWDCISLQLPDEGNVTDNIVYNELLLDHIPQNLYNDYIAELNPDFVPVNPAVEEADDEDMEYPI